MTQRIEHDLIGDREIPSNVYYGVQSLRAKENLELQELHYLNSQHL